MDRNFQNRIWNRGQNARNETIGRKVGRKARELGIPYFRLYSETRSNSRRVKLWGAKGVPFQIKELERYCIGIGGYDIEDNAANDHGALSNFIVFFSKEEK